MRKTFADRKNQSTTAEYGKAPNHTEQEPADTSDTQNVEKSKKMAAGDHPTAWREENHENSQP